jgi:hypothetical protein
MARPRVTAMVSTYRSERFLRGCLDDLLRQTLGDQLEIVVIDAASPEREGEIVKAYQARHRNLRYVRTAERETTSQAFQRATELAQGDYLTTANTDDRHHPEFAATLCAVLDALPDVGICYADSAISTVPNESWSEHQPALRFAWPHYTPATALSCCLFGAQPMWRRRAHERAGAWSDRFPIANDQDMFGRIARCYGAVHVDQVLGLFLQRPDSNAGSGRRAAVLADGCAVMKAMRSSWKIDEIVPGATCCGPDGLAAAWFELGNLCARSPYSDAQLAVQAFQQGARIGVNGARPALVRASFANNSACIMLAAGVLPAAQQALQLVPAGPVRAHNERLLQRRLAGGALPSLLELQFVELSHPIVTASRQSRGVQIDAAGQLRWTPTREQLPWDVYRGPNGVPWQPEAAELQSV